jgi:hypothetical protein
VLIILLVMIASLVLVFLGLVTNPVAHMRQTSPFVHLVLTYAGLLVTLLAHMLAFAYIIGLRNLLLAQPLEQNGEPEDAPRDAS